MYQVVIVDDEPRICEGLAQLFPWEELGFQVAGSFVNGQEALTFINSHPEVDVVLTDIEMPVMNGIELSAELVDQHVAVVYFSAYQDFHYAHSAIINRVVDYLLKPVTYDSVKTCMLRIKESLDKAEEQAVHENGLTEREPEKLEDFVKKYIEEHFQNASLEEAAALAHYSPAYLSSSFKAASGINFTEYLMSVRMRRAIELMRSPDHKLYWIAEEVGYQNPKNLSRNFKEYFGITPQEFRSGKEPLYHRETGDK